jgi:uncharacterized protein (TIGR03435 family)
MAYLASHLSLALGSPVVDSTGLRGYYDFQIELSPEDLREGSMVRTGGFSPSEPSTATSVFSSVQQLGLKLRPQKVPQEIIVVDHAEGIPIPN